MDSNTSTTRPSDAALTAAADWLQRLDDPQLAEADLQAWLEWFRESDEHRRAFEEMQLLFRSFRELQPEVRKELERRTLPGTEVRRRWKTSGTWAVAASLVAGLALVLWWWQYPGVSAETLYTAPAHQHRTVQLDDGSTLALAPGAIVAVRLSEAERAVDVKSGETYFEVRYDPGRPFIVQAAGVRVTAIGTAFNVARDDEKITVTVTEGVVEVVQVPEIAVDAPTTVFAAQVRKSREPVRVALGQRAVLPLEPGRPQLVVPADTTTSQWHDGRVEFVDTPLREVLEVVNRHADTELAIDDPRIADLTYSGTILREHLDEWIASLPYIYPIRAVPLEDGTVTLVTRRE